MSPTKNPRSLRVEADGITVLVVDDERSNVESLEKILFQREGMHTFSLRTMRNMRSRSCACIACTSCSPT